MDDCLISLASALNNAPSNVPVLIGGDFNIRPTSPHFRELLDFLAHYDISLISNPSTSTYSYSKGSSCIDHVFASRSLSRTAVSVLNIHCSDHFPVQVRLHLPRNFKSAKIQYVPEYRRTDIESAAEALLDSSLLSCPIEQLPSKIDHIFRSCVTAKKVKRNQKPWFSPYLYSLRRKCKILSDLAKVDPSYQLQYTIARKAYHTQIRISKELYNDSQRNLLVENALSKGLPALYKSAKRKSDASTIPVTDLYRYCKELFSDDQPYDELDKIPSCEQLNHPLLAEFSYDELNNVLCKVKSKAPSLGYHSPFTLKLLNESICPVLLRVYNNCLKTQEFPLTWLESVLFFLHKKGNKSLPSNYRTISIENPFLKIFMLLLNSRLSLFAESEDLIPDSQYGFRSNRNCISAASLFYELCSSRLQNKSRTYCAFIDFSKAFDKISRRLLFKKLQLLGFPLKICTLLFNLLTNLKFRVKQGSLLSSPFESSIGTPQGDPISPLLFSLYIADLPDNLPKPSVSLSNIPISCLLYADDTCILADDSKNLQLSLDALSDYCRRNKLMINVTKSKILVIHKGRLPKADFYLNGEIMERVNEFCYLGVVFTSQLSFSKHIAHIRSKAAGRVALLFIQLPLKSLSLDILIQVFNCFVLPIFLYGCHLWLTSYSTAAESSLNAVFSKFLKRYLCLPFFARNDLVYFVCNAIPLINKLKYFAVNNPIKCSFPSSLNGLRLSFLNSYTYSDYIQSTPSDFPLSCPPQLSLIPSLRRNFLLPLFQPYFPEFTRTVLYE